MRNASSAGNRVRSVSRALNILEAMAREQRGIGLVAISRLAGLDPTTTHRLLHTLEEHGFVSQNPSDGKYNLGIRVFQIGNAVTHVTILRQVTRPFIQILMERTGETASLAVADGTEAMYVEQVTGPHFLRTFTEVGRQVPMHATAVGKALMMDWNEADIHRLAQRGLKRATPNTIASEEALVNEVQRSRELGYATDMEEFEIGARCLGAPIVGSDGRILCAISISGPATRMTVERLRTLVPAVTKSAAEISQALRLSSPSLVSSQLAIN